MPITVTILRDLWRLRPAVVAIGLVAVLAGLAVGFRISGLPPKLESRRYHVGVATTRILVDTPTSQVVEVAPKGSDTLAARATLLANLMVDGVVKDAIAKRAGLRPDQLVGIADTAAPDARPEPPKPRAYALTTGVVASVSGDPLPIIEIGTQAPDARGAGRLANAAVAGLTEYLDAKAARTPVPGQRRLRVGGLGGAQVGTAVRGPSILIAIVATMLALATGCAVLLVSRAVVRDWRAAPYHPGDHDALAAGAAWPERDGGGDAAGPATAEWAAPDREDVVQPGRLAG